MTSRGSGEPTHEPPSRRGGRVPAAAQGKRERRLQSVAVRAMEDRFAAIIVQVPNITDRTF